MIYIQIDEPNLLPFPIELLRRAADEALVFAQAPEDAELTIVITGDEQLCQLNQQFMGIEAPTDVLSFPADLLDPDSGQLYLGDVLISLPRAQAQAPENGQTVQAEVLLLAVHGVLHLLGYDHADAAEKDRMWTAQAAILSRVETKPFNA